MSSVENFWPMFRPTSPRLCAKIVLLHALRFTRHKIGYSGDVLLGRSLSFVLNKLDVMPNSHCPNRREKTVLSQRVGRCALSMTQHTRTNWPKWKKNTHTKLNLHWFAERMICWIDCWTAEWRGSPTTTRLLSWRRSAACATTPASTTMRQEDNNAHCRVMIVLIDVS